MKAFILTALASFSAFAGPAVAGDTTGATCQATTAAGGLPNRIDWGDGTSDIRLPGATVAIQHKYAASGNYTIRSHYLGKVRDTKTQAVTIT